MKTTLVSLITILPLVTAAQGAGFLLGGWDGTSNDAIQSPAFSSFVTATLTNTSPGGDVTNSFSQISGSVWGTTTLDVDPTSGTTFGIWNSSTLLTLTLTVTNTGLADLSLDAIHFNTKRDNATTGPTAATITYTAGDLADTVGANAVTDLSGTSVAGWDVALNGFLTDTTLSKDESATFTWVSSGGSGGNHRLDNFAISSAVPEPSSAALIGLAGLAFIARRRRS